MRLDPPERLIDPATGEVTLLLYPYHLDRLHGLWPTDLDSKDEAIRAGLPFPFLPEAEPLILKVRGGVTPAEVASLSGLVEDRSEGEMSWQRWHGHSLTPFGWVHAAPFYKNFRLSNLGLSPYGTDERAKFDAMDAWLERELGGPGERIVSRTFWPFNPPDRAYNEKRRWQFPWGKVTLFYDPRDWTAEMAVAWSI